MTESLQLDLASLFQSWPYDPGQVKVRKIRGADGREKIQMRIDLGILQMESQGRPDGKRPFGYESLFDYHLAELDHFIRTHGSPIGFSLSPQECAELRHEAMQYYYRYLSCFYLSDYAGVQRDTRRNLQMFDFVRAYAEEDDDRYLLEQQRPYVIMMHARARAYQRLREQKPQAAVDMLIAGINEIRNFFDDIGQASMFESSDEVELLRKMAEEILKTVPRDAIQSLRDELRAAVAREDFERAANLRDEIRRLEKLDQAGQPA